MQLIRTFAPPAAPPTPPPPAALDAASPPAKVAARSAPRQTPAHPSWVTQVRALVAKDLLAEWRGRDVLTSTGVFALLVLVIFTFAFDLRAENALLVAPGALWVAFTFAATLALGRSMALEAERGTLEGLLLCPTTPGTIYLSKLLTNLLFTAALEAFLLPVFAVFFNAPVLRPAVVAIAALGTLGLVATGTLLAAMAAGTRAREILLPVLLFPIAVPVLIAAVKATAAALDAGAGGIAGQWDALAAVAPWLKLLAGFDVLFVAAALDAGAGGVAGQWDALAAVAPWLKLLAGFDVLFVAAGYLTFDYVVEQ